MCSSDLGGQKHSVTGEALRPSAGRPCFNCRCGRCDTAGATRPRRRILVRCATRSCQPQTAHARRDSGEAQAHGAANPLKVNAVLRHGLLINLSVGFVVMVLIYLMRPLMNFMGQPDEVVTLGVPYLQIITASILPTMVYQTFRQFCEGLQHTRMAMVVIIFSNLINILLNYLLIFGVAGFPELGLAGAGWATFIARCEIGRAHV